MGVYISKMKMPLGCHLCGFYDGCKNISKSLGRYNLERAPGCPLIEIKTPHGKLVDVRRLIIVHDSDGAPQLLNCPTVLDEEDEDEKNLT